MLLKSFYMNVIDVHSENNSNVGFPFPKQDTQGKNQMTTVLLIPNVSRVSLPSNGKYW